MPKPLAFRSVFGLLAITLTLALLDYVTGPRISFTLFYVAPVGMAGWWLGSRAAWAFTALVSCAQFFNDIAWAGQEISLIALWNLFTRVAVTGVVGHALAWLRRDRDQLNQLLAERTSAHVATVDQLRHRDRLALIGQLASGLAHELGTPLNVVSGRARLLDEALSPGAEERGHVRSILEQTERMTAIIRQLLDFARRRGPDLGRADLHDLCRGVLDLLRPLANKRGVTLSLVPPKSECRAHVDYNQIQQAVSNLVMNAVQAMPEGGTVTLQVQNATTPSATDELILSVQDTGMGIAKEHLARIFEPFFTTQGAGDGTGLGLSITEGIVRDHGGYIEVSSELGHGSCFRLHLPRGAASATSERSAGVAP